MYSYQCFNTCYFYLVFKTMRGSSMYYEDAKKKLMAMLRQEGSPSIFLTVSCAEYKWKELVRQILETGKLLSYCIKIYCTFYIREAQYR